MFGYILVSPKTLSNAEKARYRAVYCGLCHALSAYGAPGRAALSYDMTFVALLLQSVYGLTEESGCERCAARPIRRHRYVVSEATEYAADMNVLFAYYDALDDWNDEKDKRALARSRRLGRYLPDIAKKWPAQVAKTEECIGRLSDMERHNILNPDEPANCFGALMGEILDWRGEGSDDGADAASASADVADDSAGASVAAPGAADAPAGEKGSRLRRMGEALGRYVYLLDASNDLRGDIRHERYNPLIAQTSMDFESLLTMLIGECTREFEKLSPERDVHLLRNVLYSGVWMRYRRKEAARND